MIKLGIEYEKPTESDYYQVEIIRSHPQGPNTNQETRKYIPHVIKTYSNVKNNYQNTKNKISL